jgi:hypothetical protein
MELPEYNRHRIRTQLIKIIARLREARMEINLSDTNIKIIRNAQTLEGIATLQLDFTDAIAQIDAVTDQIASTINTLVSQADILRQAMEHPDAPAPPLTGAFLSFPNLTAEQRSLAREGHLPYTDTPTHHTPANPNRPPATPAPLPEKVLLPYPKRRKPRNDMPI